MAIKSSVAAKSSSKTRNSKAKSGSFSGRLPFLHASNIIVAAFFVLGFAGYGTWYVNSSHAATPSYCVQHIYYEYETSGQCVKNIQTELDGEAWMWNGGKSLNVDGIFGPTTKTAVIKYGNNMLHYNNNGVIGRNMWISLCSEGNRSSGEMYDVTYGGPTSDGCGKVPPSTYGNYYVGMATAPKPNKNYASNLRSKYAFPIPA